MVLWMELLMGAPHPASAVDLWVGARVWERVFGCFLAGWGDRWLEAEPILVLTRREGAGFVLTRDHSN